MLDRRLVDTECPKCKQGIPDKVWGCPNCGAPARNGSGQNENEQEITAKGMWVLLSVCIFFPVLLFIIHIIFPGL
ncbi:MAG: hypothetical protein DRQ61_09330 [Gammaproteobacteria bacterium]|nr:MAG: hypothetical protein DRQ61_09330 [Gammaproteobacteria bacterium]